MVWEIIWIQMMTMTVLVILKKYLEGPTPKMVIVIKMDFLILKRLIWEQIPLDRILTMTG